MRRSLLLCWIACFFLAFGLSSCLPVRQIDTDITIELNNEWKFTVHTVIDKSAAQIIGDGSLLAQRVTQQYQIAGVTVSPGRVSKDTEGNLVFPVTMDGRGLDRLNAALFNGYQAFREDPNQKGRVSFHYNPATGGNGFPSVGLIPQTYTLHAGRILSSNGQQIGSRRVKWVNPRGEMTAVVQESADLTVLYVLAGLAAFIVMLFLVLRRKAPGLAAAVPASTGEEPAPQPTVKYCVYCGKPGPAWGRFCPYCGKKI